MLPKHTHARKQTAVPPRQTKTGEERVMNHKKRKWTYGLFTLQESGTWMRMREKDKESMLHNQNWNYWIPLNQSSAEVTWDNNSDKYVRAGNITTLTSYTCSF